MFSKGPIKIVVNLNQDFTHNLFAIQKKGWINRGGENQRQKNLFEIRPEVQNAEHSTESRAFVQFGQFSHSPFVSLFFFLLLLFSKYSNRFSIFCKRAPSLESFCYSYRNISRNLIDLAKRRKKEEEEEGGVGGGGDKKRIRIKSFA